MPRKRRTPRARRRRPTEYGRGHLFHLKKGYWFFPLDWPTTPNGGDPIEHAWRELREEVLEEWLAERPGTRPWAWWRYDAPEPRRVVAGEEHARSGYRPGDTEQSFSFGRPATRYGADSAEYEPENVYLERLGLLY